MRIHQFSGVRPFSVVVIAVAALIATACSDGGSGDGTAGVGGEPTGASASPSAETPSEPVPIPEGQSSMAPGTYLARTEPAIELTTTTPWFGAANTPGFVVFGQLNEIPFAEIYLRNFSEVFGPTDERRVEPAPDDLVSWFLDHPSVETVGQPTDVEVGDVPGRQVDVRVADHVTCPDTFDVPCVYLFPLEVSPPWFGLFEGQRVRVIDVDTETPLMIMYADADADFDERVVVAEAVIDSIQFVR